MKTSDEELNEFDYEGDEELNLLTRKFKKKMKKLRYGKNRKVKGTNKDKIVCFEWKKPRHYKPECRKLTSK